jgi:5-methylcytosine-specific restriction endonuclease McrA
MAIAPRTPCTYPSCRRLALPDSGRCAAHPRPSASARGYTARWSAYARSWLRRYPWCGMRQDGVFHMEHSWCVRRGLRVRARVVDHIRSIATGGDVFDPANHQSLCPSCNSQKG